MAESIKTQSPSEKAARIFLCVVDESEELSQALHYACRRAKSTGGRVALLYVIELAEFQHWMAIGNLMQEERREHAEEMLKVISSTVQNQTGQMPIIHIREGKVREELLKLIEEEQSISVLVLGAATGPDGPGPLVSYLVTKMAGRLRVPITIVPGSLSDDEIDEIS
jgi:nucleotide-binding universal stress UspA family protein